MGKIEKEALKRAAEKKAAAEAGAGGADAGKVAGAGAGKAEGVGAGKAAEVGTGGRGKKKLCLPVKILLIVVAALCLAAAVFVLCGLNYNIEVTDYEVATDEISGSIVIAQISDLHSCRYGENMETLIQALEDIQPDLVALTGDIFDDGLDPDNALTFLAAIADKYPCYYVPGNHETWLDEDDFTELLETMDGYGIHILYDEYVPVTVGENSIYIAGIGADHVSSRFLPLDAKMPTDRYSVLLGHYPQYTKLYEDSAFDLVLTGHAHGGLICWPGTTKGLFAPDQGFFPEYTAGVFSLGSTTMVICRGLAKESTMIPRLYNRPEIAVITVKGEE